MVYRMAIQFVLTLCVLLLATIALASTYYVSPQGDDSHTGLGPDPASALQTIQAGVDRLRAGDTLLLRGGVYRETVVFSHSGTAGRPITVKPCQGEKVTVSGCDLVAGWTLHDAQKNIWQAPMPWTLGLGRNQAFAKDNALIEARYPNTPAPGLGMYVSDLSPLWPTFGEFSLPQETAQAQPGRIISKLLDGQPEDYWKGAVYYGNHYEGWAAQTGVVESSRSGEIQVGDRTRTWWFGSEFGGGYANEEGRGMLVGHINALDMPGEWHWQDNTIYLIPKNGKAPKEIEAKRRQLAFDLSGREFINLSGLAVKAASARLQDSAYCTFNRCDFSYISHYTKHYEIGQIEQGRDTIKSGETGIFVSGHDNSFLNCSVRISAGAGFYLRGYHHTIHNCLIDEVSYTAHYLNAITDAVSDFSDYENFLVGGHVITYNTMRNAGRHFFNFYGNGTSLSSRTRSGMDYMATLFAHNHLYNGMLQTKDAGFITGYYSSGGTLNGLNSQVAYNVLHDSYDLAAMRWGVLGLVYLDAGSCDVDLYNNLLWAAPGSLQRGLWYNTMCVDVHERDNVFHPEFTRTSAQLKPVDFPGGKPFRFGHDFTNLPPLPKWPQLVKQRIDVNCNAADLKDGAVISLGEVDFSPGWQSGVLRFASAEKALNSNHTARQAPRHRNVSDPLIMEVTNNDGLQEKIKTQWTFIHGITDSAWIRFNQMPLGEGYKRFRVIYGNDQPVARRLEVHLDAIDGPLIGEVSLPQTDKARGGSIQIYAEAVGTISPAATGTHDVFIVFRTPEGKVGEFEYFRFEQYRGQIPLQENEVKLELRLGSKDGEKIGEFYPRGTEAADNYRDLVASLDPVQGKQPLFMVVRSAYSGAIGSIAGLSLEKAQQPVDWTGVGTAPVLVDGKPVYPQATNRPCARPGDEFAKPRDAAMPAAGRPIATATVISRAPVMDGKLDEWPLNNSQHTVKLTQDPYGAMTPVPPSQAWVGYDAQALYIAMRHPVNNAAALLPSSHQWGEVDGVEVAFQNASAAKPGAILTLYGYPDGEFTSENYGGASPAQIAKLKQGVSYKAVVGDKEWTCEWRIPFSVCGFTAKSAPLWAFNLGARKLAPQGWAVWQGTGGATYQVGTGGLLVFPAEMLAKPLPVDQLEVHLDALAAKAVTTDAEGYVSAWKDQSGKGRDAQQADVKFQPQLISDGMYGRPVLRFDEQRFTRLELPNLSDKQISATVIAVASNPLPGAEVNHDPRIFTASDGKEFDFQVGIALSVTGMETGGPRVLKGVFATAWAKSVRVGCFSPGDQTYFTGDIAEILVYSRLLKPQEEDFIRAYLTAKWGLSD